MNRICKKASHLIAGCEASFYSFSFAFSLQIIWVMIPMGQKLHQVPGLNRTFTTKPMMVDVSIML